MKSMNIQNHRKIHEHLWLFEENRWKSIETLRKTKEMHGESMKRLRSSQKMHGIQRTAIKFCRKSTHISGKSVESHRKSMGNHENAWNIFGNLRKSMKVNRHQQKICDEQWTFIGDQGSFMKKQRNSTTEIGERIKKINGRLWLFDETVLEIHGRSVNKLWQFIENRWKYIGIHRTSVKINGNLGKSVGNPQKSVARR